MHKLAYREAGVKFLWDAVVKDVQPSWQAFEGDDAGDVHSGAILPCRGGEGKVTFACMRCCVSNIGVSRIHAVVRCLGSGVNYHFKVNSNRYS